MRARGFTLLELLVAMAVLAILGTLAFRGLESILDAEARVRAETRRWGDVSLLFSQLGEDLTMAVARSARGPAGLVAPALLLHPAPADPALAEEPQLVITRLGIGEGAPAQSAPRRVGYRLRQGVLEYLVWASPDSPPGAPASYALIEGISALRFQALDVDGGWAPEWPVTSDAASLPRAVSVRLALAGGEEITRIFLVR